MAELSVRMTPAQYQQLVGGSAITKAALWQKEQRDRAGDGLNKLERSYLREILEPRRLAGELLQIVPQCFSLKLAEQTHLRPDFLVWCADGTIELHDAKGRWDPGSKAKWKIAAERYPMFRFVIARREARVWHVEIWSPRKGVSLC